MIDGRRIRTGTAVFLGVLLALAFAMAACSAGAERRSAPPAATSSPPVDASSPSAPESPPLQAVVINDSFTAQSQYGGVGGKNWTSRLHRAIGQAGVDVYMRKEDRVVGYSANGPQGPTFQSAVARMVNADTDLVILFGGGNDVRSMPALADGVTRAISEVRTVAPGAKIILIGPTWPRPEPPSEQILAVDDTIGTVAAENNVEFISPIKEDWFAGDSALMAPDGIHSSNAGHEVISRRLADRVIDALRSANDPSVGHP